MEIEVPYWHQAAPNRTQSGPVLNLLVSEQKNKCAPTTVLLLDKHIYIIYLLKWKMSAILLYVPLDLEQQKYIFLVLQMQVFKTKYATSI